MLKIRLQRVGRKGEPAMRLVLTESENSTKSGRFKEILGSYDPRKSTDLIKHDRIKYWLEKGAKATGSVHNLLLKHKVIEGSKVNVLPKKTYTPPIVEAPAEVPASEAAVETVPETVEEAEVVAPVETTDVAETAPEPSQVEAAPEAAEAPAETPIE